MNLKRSFFKLPKINKKFIAGVWIILMLSIFPFFIILLITSLLKLVLNLSEYIPNEFICLKIDMTQTVTLSEFIYYCICIISAEVTAIFSWLVFKLTYDKYVEGKQEKKELQNNKIKIMLYELLNELKNNYDEYIKERYSKKWSFKKALEINGDSQYGYNELANEFNTEKWNKNLIHIKEYLEDKLILNELTQIYSIFQIIRTSKDINQLKHIEFEGFSNRVIELVDKLEIIIQCLSDNRK